MPTITVTQELFDNMTTALRMSKNAFMVLADTVGENEAFSAMFNEEGVAFEAFMSVDKALETNGEIE